ncbi:luciferase family protein [uncultured Ruegeria sp.]|uniref:luciferase domain-containing protein n=1 Tax=uncultured Ruegeria sp. TaxID=259304 RepID=UPI0026322D53|nr:luciferase family protein [uncultured Ruegeria sp.]
MQTFRKITAALLLGCIGVSSVAQSTSFPERNAPRPQTTDGVPHVQIGIEANSEITEELLRRVGEFPGVTLGATRVSLPGATGFQLNRDVKLARPEAIVGGREFAHVHPDGSLHASLDPDVARAAIQAGWAIAHPWADQRDGWEGFVMIYTPQTEEELEIVYELVQNSYTYVTGATLP